MAIVTRVASVFQQPENAGLLRAAFTALNPLWAGAHGVDVEFKVEIEKIFPALFSKALQHQPRSEPHRHGIIRKQHIFLVGFHAVSLTASLGNHKAFAKRHEVQRGGGNVKLEGFTVANNILRDTVTFWAFRLA